MDSQVQSAELADQVIALLGEKSCAGDSERLEAYARQFLHHVPPRDLGRFSAADWAVLVNQQFQLLKKRVKGQTLVHIANPDLPDGRERHTVVDILSGNRPFLVDSATMAISEFNLTMHLSVHPLVRVERDAGGFLMAVLQPGDDADLGQTESVIHLQIDRQTDPGRLAAIAQVIERNLADVASAVNDWRPMLTKGSEVADELLAAKTPYGEDVIAETVAFIRWLVDEHFTFLGYRRYAIEVSEAEGSRLVAQPGSGLGILKRPSPAGDSRSLQAFSSLDPLAISASSPVVVTKANSLSTVHRSGYLDYLGVMIFDDDGKLVGEHRFLGLYTSAAYNRRPWNIPLVRKNVQGVIARSVFEEYSHGGKALLHIMETLPRDELIQASPDELFDLVMGVFELQERQKTRLLVRRDAFGRFFSCLVYIPRDRFNTETREQIQEILKTAFGGDRIDFTVQIAESMLARLHVIVRVPANANPQYDVAQIEADLVEAVRSWHDKLRDILVAKYGEGKGVAWTEKLGASFPAAYIEDVAPWVAAFDVENLAKLESTNSLGMSLYRPRNLESGVIRFKIFRWGHTIPLSDVLPILENMGLHIVSERPYRLPRGEDDALWIQDFDMVLDGGDELDLEKIDANFQEAFEQVVRGHVEDDGFNRLILGANLSWRQVALLRAFCKFWLQTGCPFSQRYIERTLIAHPQIVRLLVALFAARLDPALAKPDEALLARFQLRISEPALALGLWSADGAEPALPEKRPALIDFCRALVLESLERVRSSDEDRILRSYVDLVDATLRTNAYQGPLDDPERGYISLKFESSGVPDMPRPFPWREIFVYSPEVEGVHLRGGPVARGGLRWSDRFEDFRTEVLGLMKAQTVKNTIIVPVGAKGGFVAKQIPDTDDRDQRLAKGVASYRKFINGLLEISDNLVDGKVCHPKDVVRHDGEDPYLVVAADKGTATFSDIANAVAHDHGFWLGDAFASGGSVGYDHKKMGITARGGWESVKRHFRELGVNCQTEPFTVVGIGDMSGDVFGNGLLLSKTLLLKAAFNHEHIFLDPNPDAAVSFAERQRLFALPRSGWMDYDSQLISAGGGVFSRREKNLPVSPEVASWLGIKSGDLSPTALIRILLCAPVDLLWNGGIGTYVKGRHETSQDVGDRSNDALRVNGGDLRCKVVGEGGNLGLTQRGRIEYALAGGRLNTDFIDNSAGVDCSDHEVNIKILVNAAVAGGDLAREERTALLVEMTDEVGELVLRNNYLQTQALSMMEALTVNRLGSKGHFINILEARGILDRNLEGLPGVEELADRRARGLGLARPELAVLLSYSKIILYQDLLASDVPEDSYLSRELERYFPQPLRERFAHCMAGHRLRREIIANAVTNSMVNRMGATFCMRMHEETGATAGQVARAYTAAREIFAARRWWEAIEASDNEVASSHQTTAHLLVWSLLRHATRWLLSHHRNRLDIAKLVTRYGNAAGKLMNMMPELVSAAAGKRLAAHRGRLISAGFASDLVKVLAGFPALNCTLDVIDVSRRTSHPVEEVARVYHRLDHQLKLGWLLAAVEKLPVDGQWHANARGALRDELYNQHQRLTTRVMQGQGNTNELMKAWASANLGAIQFFEHMMADMKGSGSMDYAKGSVAVRGLEQLVAASSRAEATTS